MSKPGRSTVYNRITTPEKLEQINEENTLLEEDFLEYLVSTDRAQTTITQYRSVLHIFWCWNLDNNKNKAFTDLTKREIARFQNHAINKWGWSPRRVRMAKSVMRSLENYVLNILDDDYPDYKKIWDKIESPVNEPVREKTVLTDEDEKKLLDTLVKEKKFMQACFVSLAVNSGRRKSELVKFKASYFDKENLICEGALYKTPEKMTTKGRGHLGKQLYVYTLAKPFQPYLDLWLERRRHLGIKSDWLFPRKVNNVWKDEHMPTSTPDSWVNHFSRVLKKPIYIHLFRHKFTTKLSESGIPDNVIKDLIGWSDVAMVDVYRDTEAEDTFDKYFGADGIKKVEKTNISDL